MLDNFAVMLQGNKSDCAVLRLNDLVMVVDTGWEEDFSALDDFLESQKVEEIDFLILSHYDLDHVGGATKLMSSYDVKALICPNYLPKKEEKQKQLKKMRKIWQQFPIDVFLLGCQKLELQRKEVSITCHPSPLVQNDDEKDENEYSMLTSIQFQDKKFLFMGDAETKLTKFALDVVDTHDFLKIPHHGRMNEGIFTNANLGKLLKQVSPTFSLVTCKEKQEEDVLKALKKLAPDTKFASNLHGNTDILAEI